MSDFFNDIELHKIIDILLYDPKTPLLFNTGLFLILFAIFMVLYEGLRQRYTLKLAVTILFSLYFYYKSSAECCFLLMGICLSDYLLGRWLGVVADDRKRRLIVTLNIVMNIGMLVYFKYFNLLAKTWTEMRQGDFDAFDIILPAGISFITFRSISYIIDVYRRDIEPEKNLLHYVFCLTFFPPLLAGPVVRAKDLLPQIRKQPVPDKAMISKGIFLIMTGLIKKVIVADFISDNFVNRVFDNPALYSGFENLMGCIGFTIQLYCDFSGYSDIAIGIALLMGFRFLDNFRAPFKAQNPSEFWRRWHISLSTWLRDYLYIPMGGSRRGKWRTYINNFLTMILGGLWHGAGWMYLLWGTYHGILLAGHKALKKVWCTPEFLKGTLALRVINTALTFCLIVIGFTIFRADSLATLEAIGSQVFGDFHLSVAPQFIESYFLIALAIFASLFLHFTPRNWTTGISTAYSATPIVMQGILLAIVLFFVIQARSSDIVPFIYLQY